MSAPCYQPDIISRSREGGDPGSVLYIPNLSPQEADKLAANSSPSTATRAEERQSVLPVGNAQEGLLAQRASPDLVGEAAVSPDNLPRAAMTTVTGTIVSSAPRNGTNSQMQRRFRTQIAEDNYRQRNMWGRVPETVYTSFANCLEALPTVRRTPHAGRVTFSTWSTADAVLQLTQRGRQKLCCLNFANGVQVGGGYKTGALAQEEDLCRRIPTLYTSLYRAKEKDLYPFGPSTCQSKEEPSKYSDVLYTPGLIVARRSEEEEFRLLPKDQQAKASMVTAAAPNVKANELYDLDLMYNTVKAIFVAPKIREPEVDTLILGAWGCGAFGCNPKDVSTLFAKALLQDGLGQLYNEVHFAIPKFDAAKTGNFEAFRDTLLELQVQIQDIET